MLISLLADPHLANDPSQSHGVDTQTNFSRTIARLREIRPDHVIMMGDYSVREPVAAHVDWLASRVQLAGAPVDAIPGNHDDSKQVAKSFGIESQLVGSELYYRRDLGADRALFLDTSRGSMSADQIEWLHMEVRAARKRILVFMHHPPVEMGVPYMDDHYALSDPDHAIHEALFSNKLPVHVFCGHYHTARSSHIGPHSIHLCPSTYFQLNPENSEFEVAHSMPGMRHIKLLSNQLRTWIEFLPPAEASPA